MNKTILSIYFISFFLFTSCKEKACFKKIVFETGFCEGTCPMNNLEVYSNKKIKLTADISKDDFEIDTILSGYYEGIVPDSLFNELIENYKNLNFIVKKSNWADCQTIDIKIFDTNDNQILISTNYDSIKSNQSINNLVLTLEKICNSKNLKK